MKAVQERAKGPAHIDHKTQLGGIGKKPGRKCVSFNLAITRVEQASCMVCGG